MWVNIGFAILLLVVSALMMGEHALSWRRTQSRQLDRVEFDFLQRRYQSRMQTSLLIGVIGVLIFIGIWVDKPRAMAVYWLGVSMIVGWLLLAASADWSTSYRYLSQVRGKFIAEREALRADIKRQKSELQERDKEKEGKADDNDNV